MVDKNYLRHKNKDKRDDIMRMGNIRYDWTDHSKLIWYEIYVKQMLKYTPNKITFGNISEADGSSISFGLTP
jgi:hypothetical protein